MDSVIISMIIQWKKTQIDICRWEGMKGREKEKERRGMIVISFLSI